MLSRRLTLGLLGSAAACATTPAAMVNLAREPASGVLETAFDNSIRITVPVYLDDAGPFEFVVDTGANVSVIASDLADRLGLPRIGVTQVHGIAGVFPAELTTVRRRTVGVVSSPVPRMPILPRAQLGADGLLGMDVLRNRRLILDFKGHRMQIAAPAASPSASAGRVVNARGSDAPQFVVPARIRFGQLIIVDAQIAGVRLMAFLDSGSQSSVGNPALRRALALRNPGFASSVIRSALVSVTGQIAEAEIIAMPPLRLGGLTVGNLTVGFADLHIFEIWNLQDRPAMLIGADILREFDSVEIDYGVRQVTFRPPRELLRDRLQ